MFQSNTAKIMGGYIKDRRLELKVSLEAASELVGLDQCSFTRIEWGKKMVPTEDLPIFIEALNLDPNIVEKIYWFGTITYYEPLLNLDDKTKQRHHNEIEPILEP